MSTCVIYIYNRLPFKNYNKPLSVALVLLVALSGLSLGCSDTVSDPGVGASGAPGGIAGSTVAGTPGDPMAGTVGDPTAGAAGPVEGSFNFAAQLVESVTEDPIPPDQLQLTVKVVDNTTGAPLGIEAKSDANSMVSFQGLPTNPIGFLIPAEQSQTIDTFQFNIDSSRQDETLQVVAMSSVMTAPTFTGIPLDPAKAVAAGAIYWVDPATGEEIPVGCANVAHTAADGTAIEGEVRYFGGNNLPCANAPRPEAPNQEVRTSTNPLNGRFYIANATPGQITVHATLNGAPIGETTLMIFAGNTSTDGQYSISLSNIYVQSAADPTPADCVVDYL